MLIAALVLAVIGLAALVTAVATSNEVIAWVCIGASSLGVLLLIIDAIRERAHRRVASPPVFAADETEVIGDGAETAVIASEPLVEDVPIIEETEVIEAVEGDDEAPDDEAPDDEAPDDGAPDDDADDIPGEIADEDYPDEVVHDDPDSDTPSEDEPDFPASAEEAAVHIIDEDELLEQELPAEELEDRPEEAELVEELEEQLGAGQLEEREQK